MIKRTKDVSEFLFTIEGLCDILYLDKKTPELYCSLMSSIFYTPELIVDIVYGKAMGRLSMKIVFRIM